MSLVSNKQSHLITTKSFRCPGGLEIRPLRVTGKLARITCADGTGTDAGLALVFVFPGRVASAFSLGSSTSCGLLVLAGADSTGVIGPRGVTAGMLIGKSLLLLACGSLLLLRCLLFLLKTRPSSVLTSYDPTSTCCSTRALCHWPDLSVGFTRTTSPLLRGGSS